MLRKSLLSLAVAASLAGMTGCQISSVDGNSDVDPLPVASGEPGYVAPAGTSSTAPVFNPASGQLPLQIDIFFSGTTDGTLFFDERGGDIALGATGYNPVVNALQDMDGFSTGGFIDIPFSASLDAASVAKFGLSANPNVLLIPVQYTAGDDVVTKSLAEGDSPIGFGTAVDAEITAISYVGDVHANSVLRIAPKTPLMPKTRYLVVITDGLKDSKGDKIRAASAYDDIRSDRELVSTDLEPLRPAVRGWEDMAAAYLAGLNAVTSGTQGKGNIALAYTFTTGGTLDVLSVMTAPGNANTALKPDATVTALSAVINPALTDAQNLTALATAIAGSQATPVDYAGLKALVDSGGATAEQAGALAAFDAGALQAFSVIDLGVRPRASDFSDASPTGTILLSERGALNDGTTVNNVAAFVDGSIKLPYYLEAPVGGYSGENPLVDGYADPAQVGQPAQLSAGRLVTSKWSADTDLATNLGNPLLTAPSDRVTRLFPFAKKSGYVDVPVLAVMPTNPGCAKPYPVVIYQHGIFGDRTSGVKLAEEFAANCMATVAIDMAYHGVMPTDTTTHLAGPAAGAVVPKLVTLLASRGVNVSAMSAGDQFLTVTSKTLSERHFGLTPGGDNGFTPTAASSTDPALNKSGGFTLNIVNFPATRDAFRQSIMDLLNLNASLATMDIDGDTVPDLDASKVHFVGISYGGIIGASFAAVNNANGLHFKGLLAADLVPGKTVADFVGNESLPPLKTVNLGVAGGSILQLAENSPVYSPAVVGGIQSLGTNGSLDKGTASFEAYVQVFQGTIDSMDPLNFVGVLGQLGTPVHMIESIGDLSVANNVADAPLAGTDTLAAVLGATQIDASITPNPSVPVPLKTLVKFTDIGSQHGTFNGGANDPDTTADDSGFAEMFSQVFSFINFSGIGINVGDVYTANSEETQIVPVAAQ